MNQPAPSFAQNQPLMQGQPDYFHNQQQRAPDFYPNQQQRPLNQVYHNHYQQQPTEVSRSNLFDQIKTTLSNPAPIFILPQQQIPQLPPFYPTVQPYMAAPMCYAPPPPPPQSIQTTYLPYPMPVPSCNMMKQDCNAADCSNRSVQSTYDCQRNAHSNLYSCSSSLEDHKCCQGKDGTICVRKDCPASLSLQSLASQFLSIQGIVSCAATRILLKRIPGSNIHQTDEEIMEKTQKAIDGLTKNQLLAESRNSHQINGLINVHISLRPPINILPILTLVQLKVNVLKAKVEENISRRIMENQADNAESDHPLDDQALALKSDAELREMISCMKQKEQDQRASLIVSLHPLQRTIVEHHLHNIRVKIAQVEEEFERRRRETSNSGSTSSNSYCSNYQSQPTSSNDQFDSFEPFLIQIRSPKKLILRPHVGSPETTYEKSQQSSKEEKKTSDKNEKMIVKVVVLMEDEKSVSEGETSQESDKSKSKKDEEASGDSAKESCETEDDKSVDELVGQKENDSGEE